MFMVMIWSWFMVMVMLWFHGMTQHELHLMQLRLQYQGNYQRYLLVHIRQNLIQ